MGSFRKLQQKIADGWLKELAGELRWLRPYVGRYRGTICVHILLGILGIAMGLGGSVATKYLIDAVTGYQSTAIAPAAAMTVGMLCGTIAMKSVAGRIGAVLNVRVQQQIQAEVYEKILAADWEALEGFRSGDLLSRLGSDVGTISSGVTGFIPSLISALVQFAGAFAIMVRYDPTMALIALLGVPVSAVCSRLLVGRMRHHSRHMKELQSDVASFHQDSFQNLTSIKAFGIADLFCGRMVLMQEKYRDAYLDYNLFSVRTQAFMSLVGLVVSGSCFGWGVYRLWSGAITYGSMTMFLQLASTLSGAFSSLVGLVPSLIGLSTSTGRVMAVTELPKEEVPAQEALCRRAVSITLDNISFSYRDGEAVLQNASLCACEGDLVALTGPSGEGKTTILRILLGLVRPREGRAHLTTDTGETIPLSAATRRAFSYVPQGRSLFAGTIAENLRMVAPQATDEELWQALRAACAEEFVRSFPDGLAHSVGGRDSGISEGQAQRLAVARALLRGAPILLLDEATSALDQATEAEMLRRIMAFGKTRTCILVTHRSAALAYCTRSYHVHEGRVSEEAVR